MAKSHKSCMEQAEIIDTFGTYQRYWWSNMKQDITRYVEECDVFRLVKAEHQIPAGTLQPHTITKWKWDKIEMDFVICFPRSQKGHDAIFVVIDRFTKVAYFQPV